MAHVRQQIREAVATAITGLTSTGARVYQSRVHPLDAAKLPCLLVNTDEEEIEALQVSMPTLLDRTLTISVRAVAKVSTNLDDAMDTMISEVETALGNTNLGGLVKTLTMRGIEIEMNGEGDKPVGIATMKFLATYMTNSNAPTVAI